MEAGKLIARTHGENFHAAVRIVPHPSGDAEGVGLTLHEPAEAYALHSSAHQEAAGEGSGFLGARHSQNWKSEIAHEENLRSEIRCVPL
jgi:hypothetical protein